MNKDFSRIITLLRKERGLSQKQAAADLNISQALLSHYEKGIRECGLDFVVRTSEYYGVSCDYLLGITPQRSGATLSVDDLPDSGSDDEVAMSGMLTTLNRKLIINSINLLYSILDKTNNKGLTTEISNYIMTTVYKVFRIAYSTNAKNPQGLFAVPQQIYQGFSSAHQSISEANAFALASGSASDGFEGLHKSAAPVLSPEIINEDYPSLAPSLFNLIQSVESKIAPQ